MSKVVSDPVTEEPMAEEPSRGGPRIVVNPKVFSDKRDALCVAMNEAFRVLMEMNGFDPVSEPTEKQRKFFADTAYADDELMLRRTILARICTFDTSVTDPTTEQLQESVEFLETVMEIGAPQNEWEQQAVQRIHDILVKAAESGTAPTENTKEPEAPTDTEGTTRGAVGGGETIEDKTQTYTPTNANYTPTNANYTPTNANYTPTNANYTPTNEGYQAGALGLPSQRGSGTVDSPVSSQRPEGSIEKSWVLGRDNASRSDGSIEKSWVLTRGNSSQEGSVLQNEKIRQRVLNAGGLPFEV